MSFQDIIGQDTAKQLLQGGLRRNEISHAYIFSGPPGSGQMEMAMAFVQALFCTRGGDDACGECLECRKVLHGNHPDLSTVKPDGATIKIDQIRDLQRIFSYRSESGNPKAYIIDEAEKMTVQAANSLLKFLEDPPSPAVAILLSDNGRALLPTIQSRAQWVPFLPLNPERMLQILADEGYPATLARSAVHLAAGLGPCRELIQQNWFAEIRNVVLQLGREIAGRGGSPLITAQQSLFKAGLSDHLDMLFSLFHLWFKDMIHALYHKHDQVVFIDELEFISRHASSRSPQQWIEAMALAAESKKKLRQHMNAQLCVEQFLIAVDGQR
ncbi:DNA polymerase III subunit delta' [Paenibacillus macerans]|uniref:DNA polymerase III, delta' subunit n=1 Tax=Paenibacillus macerans TaxID=44252 RepID=A0A090XV00_PAEMA|nr:DNA polymerase III subunit delta' [Paenibacillus macerans]KFM89831.1 DNA polymerase III, delta' subunit [Paenibacillus macerans]MBS5910855.1 DNA polymerase III subunit delta' [Paenibacillus macerans]MCY7560011.1 DNA polymerase III subunit delta' [Paenibacillus macerans]MDU5945779.1 DNA polymerase III subunit delta' [Paenibacillus macerans]MEC0138012.1 DNA polymerase III subunit delta' [Paenibacillus macerans]